MVLTYIEKRSGLGYLFPILVIVILIIAIVLWQGFFIEEEPVLPPNEIPTQKIEIDFEVLKNPFLEKLQPLEVFPPFEEEVGRENPFIPY